MCVCVATDFTKVSRVKGGTKISKEQRRLLEQLGETLPNENEPEDKGLFDKVKDYFM